MSSRTPRTGTPLAVKPGWRTFVHFIERRLLGITMPPNQIIASYAARVAASLDTETLIQLLRDETAPSLLIRQSALFSFNGGAPRLAG
jgi:hypothetical protein